MPPSLIILLIVLAAIALRQTPKIIIPIWFIMTLGAVTVLVFQQISIQHAIESIETDVILYLFGIFLICQAAEHCGYLEHLTDKLFFHTKTGKQALFIIIFILGLSSALLMNDTIAIAGTPIILQLCKTHKNLINPLLMALAFGVTIGSVPSPIGNPQNLLIAVKGTIPTPFISFLKILFIPTVLNLAIAYLLIYLVHRKIMDEPITKPIPTPIDDHKTTMLVKISFAIMLLLLGTKMMLEFTDYSLHFNFGYISLIAAAPLLLSNQRLVLLKQLDWGTLVFFISTFILMQSVWDSGFLQDKIKLFNISISSTFGILLFSVILSQFISNVPLVTLYIPLLTYHYAATESNLLTLAAGSTIAGNLSILGAASTILIIQNAENRNIKCFGFFEFIKLGLPLTMINIMIYAYLM